MVDTLSYARKSPDDKDDTKTSMDNQLNDNRYEAAKKEWNIVKEFVDENITGSDRQRKGFTEMIKYAMDNRNIRIIIMKNQSRFARDSAFFMDTLKDLEAYGIKVYSRQKGEFLSSDDIGDSIMSVVDQHKITEGRKHAKELYERKLREKMPPFIAPFGYKNKNKSWVVYEKQAKIVREVCNDYINNIQMSVTLKKLKMYRSLYYRIISNLKKGVYCGYIYYNNKIRDSTKKVIRVEEVKYKGLHQPIISEELFNKATQT